MRILFLGRPDSPLIQWLRDFGEDVTQFADKLSPASEFLSNFDFLVSYNYRFMIPGQVLDHFPYRAVNLHIALLPWNRGADPNFWSFIEGTPPGVTIHYIDVGLDTGEIIYQSELDFSASNETLATTYAQLHEQIQRLFCDHWVEIREGTCPRIRQPAHYGTHHKVKDKIPLNEATPFGWDTRIADIKEFGRLKNLRVIE